MKNKFLSAIMMTMLVSTTAMAASKGPSNDGSVTFGFTSLVVPVQGTIWQPSATLAFGVSDSLAITVPVALWLQAPREFKPFNMGINAGIGLKIFLDGNVLKDSWYIHPRVVAKVAFSPAINFGIQGAASFGHLWVWDNGFTVDTGVALLFERLLTTGAGGAGSINAAATEGLNFGGELGIGYTW